MSKQYLSGERIQKDVKSGKSVDEILRGIFEYTCNNMQFESFEEWVRSSGGASIMNGILVEKKYLNP